MGSLEAEVNDAEAFVLRGGDRRSPHRLVDVAAPQVGMGPHAGTRVGLVPPKLKVWFWVEASQGGVSAVSRVGRCAAWLPPGLRWGIEAQLSTRVISDVMRSHDGGGDAGRRAGACPRVELGDAFHARQESSAPPVRPRDVADDPCEQSRLDSCKPPHAARSRN